MNVAVTPFVPGDDTELLARGLRAGDILEARKVAGMPEDEALRLAIAHSLMAGTIRINGKAASLFGVCAKDMLLHTGVPWLVAHPDFEHPAVAVPMARIIRRFLNHWLTVFSRLENVADPNHAKALQVLEWVGFSMEKTGFTGPLGHNLIYFWKESSVCV